ncbi:N-acylneuraminate cytidylyltransferase [Ruminiclostridium sufflavum DSM 19573]|uniref:N-acylneuraminate cytidylyltransferase n=1 Tax=Ruminiclostridium sufflavum DSM 19573 TaxID=1121337 RepID=A0A318XSA3_9FIRM|nr:pseudaminic acid cytidylyltransferase [Ruminiclostridium sufflavum]PYG89121.1 N-acylneuraminate cytidylyltransferase [Ruminiclostridium sufflavum DSM 19573]
MKNIAIITARGGSKRIPRKNIKEFCGRPIISYSIEAALNSSIFDEVMVSTDDAEIAEISLKYGAKVPFFRSGKTSDDNAVTADVIDEVLQQYKINGSCFDYFCCIYPTAPFITAARLKDAIETLIFTKADSLVPVVRFSFPPQRGLIIKKDRLNYKWPENMNTRSQDLEPFYHDCGQFYIMKVEKFLEKRSLITENTIPFIMQDIEVQDIDTSEDWDIAEMKYKILKNL